MFVAIILFSIFLLRHLHGSILVIRREFNILDSSTYHHMEPLIYQAIFSSLLLMIHYLQKDLSKKIWLLSLSASSVFVLSTVEMNKIDIDLKVAIHFPLLVYDIPYLVDSLSVPFMDVGK